MDLFLLDEEFEICGLIDDFSSLVWNRKYYDCGNFSLQTNIGNLEQLKDAKYLYSKEFEEVGVFETFNMKNTVQGTEILRTGRFLESKLGYRVIDKTEKFKNMTTENMIRNLVNDYVIKDDIRKIPKVKLGKLRNLGSVKTTQMTGKNLLTKIYELCREDELGISLKYDFDKDELVFEVWQGLDRRDIQSKNSWAIFSRDFENILEDDYCMDETQFCNFAYVAGELNEETNVRIIVTIDKVKDGEERRELYVDARDLQKDDDVTDEEYREMLISRGIEKLNENNKVEMVSFKMDPISNLVYKKDFDLGDKVVYKNESLGLMIENRIVEVSEVYENGEKNIDIVFGDDYDIKKLKEGI